jgi:tetratricopeptide (TPR) repeat protein
MEAVQLSLQDGLFAEASALIACGYSSGTMGVGTDVERQKRLQDLVIKRAAEGKPALAQRVQDAAAAKDVPALFNLGYSYIGLGDAATGLPLMENAVRTGSFKHIEDAKLRLGEAYLLAGQRDKAVAMFKTVAGTDGTADLARLWQLVPVSKP